MSSFILKLIAVVTMLIDHVGLLFFPQHQWIRYIGRIAFPIFAFLLSEGFIHTSNRSRYALRLGIFAVLSEIPYQLCLYGKVLDFKHQNIFFELLCGFAVLACIEKASKKPAFLALIPVLLIASPFLHFSYGIYGIVLIAAFYLLRKYPAARAVSAAVVTVVFNGIAGFGFDAPGGHIGVLSVNRTQLYAAAASALLLFYNGEKGRHSLKWFFYAFYPVHLIILLFIKGLVQGRF